MASPSSRLTAISPEEQVSIIERQKGNPETYKDMVKKLIDKKSESDDLVDRLKVARDIEAAAISVRIDTLFQLISVYFPEGFAQLPLEDKGGLVRRLQEFLTTKNVTSSHTPLIPNFTGRAPFPLPWESEIVPGVVAKMELFSLTDKSISLVLDLRRK